MKHFVIKRDGSTKEIQFDKILERIKNLCIEPFKKRLSKNNENISLENDKNFMSLNNVDYYMIAQETIKGVYSGIHTKELDVLAADIAQPRSFEHPEYGFLAARLLVSNHQKNNIHDLYTHFQQKNINISLEEINENLLYYTFKVLYENLDQNGNQYPLIAPDIYQIIIKHHKKLNQIIDYNRDFEFDYAGFNLLETSYLQKCYLLTKKGASRIPIERPQHLFIRVALGIHCSSKYQDFSKMRQNDVNIYNSIKSIMMKYLNSKTIKSINKQAQQNAVDWKEIIQFLKDGSITADDLCITIKVINDNTIGWDELKDRFDGELLDSIFEEVKNTYDMISLKYFTHATPTLFNAGTLKPQLSSCFLLQIPSDSMDSITKFWKQCATISKYAGGIGSHYHNIRSKHSYIRGTNGSSNGLAPLMKVINDISVYVDQCFHPDTMIYCADGVKKIGDIVIGDQVLTSTNFSKVQQVRRYAKENREVLKITTDFSFEPTYVTDKHLIRSCLVGLDIFMEAEQLTTDHYVMFPIPVLQSENIYTNDDCLMYGLILASGHIQDESEFCLVLQRGSIYINFVDSYLRIRNMTPKQCNISDNDVLISWFVNEHFLFNKQMFMQNDNLIIHPLMFQLDLEQTESLLAGYFQYRCIICEVSEYVAEGIKFLLFKTKKLAKCWSEDKNGYKIYWIDLTQSESFIKHNWIYCKIKEISRVEQCNTVVDLEIADIHDYTVQLGNVHNGGNKRPGSHACYLELWHADIIKFISLRKNRGKDSERARNLFYAMWIPDEFMRTLEYESQLEQQLRQKYANDDSRIQDEVKCWYLFDPAVFSDMNMVNLSNLYDEDLSTEWITDDQIVNMKDQFNFTYHYRQAIKANRYKKRVSALEIWKQICELIEEVGIPYILFKDAMNRKSNQKNLGTIKSSNLCCEIGIYSSKEEIGVCNLLSINLAKLVKESVVFSDILISENNILNKIDWVLFERIIRQSVRNLNKIIDINYYVLPEAEYSNCKNRPLGIGVQNMARLMTLLRIPFNSEESHKVNFYIFEFMYYIALDESANLSIILGPYASFKGSPLSKGEFQFDMWIKEQKGKNPLRYNLRLDWESLRTKVMKYGVRNSLLIALMPTSSTSTIFGATPAFEPYTGLIFKRRNRTGEIMMVDPYFQEELIRLGLWNQQVRNELLLNNKGSMSDITQIPKEIRDLFLTVWDIGIKDAAELSLTRGPFVDQAISDTVFIPTPNLRNLTQLHFYKWRRGVKTSSYYTRRLAVIDAQKIQVEGPLCTMKAGCITCTS